MPQKVLVYRFSSFGDVLITIPVLISALESNPELTIYYFTRAQFADYLPKHKRLRVSGLNFEKDFRGIFGILKLYKNIQKKGPFDFTIDLHNVLRTKILNLLLYLSGENIYKLQKNRKLKKDYISGRIRKELPRTMELYSQVFERAGIHFTLNPVEDKYFSGNGRDFNINKSIIIGIAPFAKHKSKTWPLEKFSELITILNKKWDINFFIIGSKRESQIADSLAGSNITNVCGKLHADDEISLIRQMDLLISMDSANMHLADILGTRVISIWGGTHPDLGFRPSFQKSDDLVSPPVNLDCRPCSVYGKSTCKLKSDKFICLNSIQADHLADIISSHLQKKY